MPSWIVAASPPGRLSARRKGGSASCRRVSSGINASRHRPNRFSAQHRRRGADLFITVALKRRKIAPFETCANCGKESTMSTSIRNRLSGTVEKILSDKVVSELVIKTAAGNVTSIITTGSVERMNLKEGDKVFAIIKATEVSVEKE
jgi:molybdopterin-binding protein